MLTINFIGLSNIANWSIQIQRSFLKRRTKIQRR